MNGNAQYYKDSAKWWLQRARLWWQVYRNLFQDQEYLEASRRCMDNAKRHYQWYQEALGQ
ncbi:unnamed protein product [marine sediment metagenome]|uniref:Uncharacterized protein n=1 Tax=marine sediment metagenome TaxID=412755 RepID=X0U0E3_9ZZZZ